MKTSILLLSAKDLRGKSGIYMISCNSRNYIGSSKSLYDRLLEHRQKLLNNKHSNDFLQKAFNKYGIDSFNYEIIEFCLPEDRIIREKHFINTLKPDFNLQLDPIDKTLSVYSKQKLSKSVLQGRANGKYKTKYDYCTVEVYNYFGNYVTSYKNKEEAAEKLNISKKIVQKLTSGYKKGLSRKGIRLRYANSKVPVTKFEIDPKYLGHHFDFYYDGKFAFSSVKNVWEFLSTVIQSGKTKIEIEIKLKTN
jgi:hypothetical protein